MWDLLFSNSDLVLDDTNQLATVDDTDRVNQDIEHALMAVLGSDGYNQEFGTDWLKIKHTNFNRKLIEHEIKKALGRHPDIKSIDRMDIGEPDSNRKTDITVYLTLVSGDQLQTEVSI